MKGFQKRFNRILTYDDMPRWGAHWNSHIGWSHVTSGDFSLMNSMSGDPSLPVIFINIKTNIQNNIYDLFPMVLNT